jgi:DNA-binding NtrC family response regulator
MTDGKIIIIDDNKSVLSALKILLQFEFDEVAILQSPNLLVSKLQTSDYDVALLDMNFTKNTNTGNEGIFWLQEIKKYAPLIEVVMFTAYGDIELAVRTLKEGAFDFVVKPWDNNKLIATLQSAYKLRVSKLEVKELKNKEKSYKKELAMPSQNLIGSSPAFQKVMETIHKVAKTEANILLTGENGTGKELFAREIHRLSLRKEESFVLVDMSSLPETLFESELFGHKRGAFTDAKEDRTGKFLLAQNGTLFLDEIGNLPLQLQSKLLTVLQSRKLTPVGSDKEIPFDVRLICATNANIDAMVSQKNFREDLLYRINTIHITIPPLRERIEDIKPLVDHFIEFFNRRYHKTIDPIQNVVLKKLIEYSWPGNIRELQHTVERAVILSDKNYFTTDDFLLKSQHFIQNNAPVTLEDMEKQMITKAINKFEGNMSLAAHHLGVTRQTLYNKLKKYGF